jgi:hypothetical protein
MRPERHGETAAAEALRAELRHVYWIGGGSGAGKSIIARGMAARHGLRLHATDDVMSDHGSRCAPEDCPFLSEFAATDMDERWVNRSPETMLETFTERLYEEATRLELRIIEVGTTMTEDDLAERVTEAFGL